MKLRRKTKEPEAPAKVEDALAPADLGERMLPSALEAHAPIAPVAAEAPKRRSRFADVRFPPLGPPLGVVALLLALVSALLTATDSVMGVLLLPVAAAMLGLAALLPAGARKPKDAESAKLRLVGLALVTLAMALCVAVVQGLALPAAMGVLFSFSQLAAVFVRSYPLLLALFVAAGATMRIIAGRWGGLLGPRAGRRALAAALTAVALLTSGALVFAATPSGEELLGITVERAPFVAGLAVLVGLVALWAGSLPSFQQMGDWLARPGLRRSRLARDLVAGFAGSALLMAGAGLAVWFLGAETVAVPLLAGAGLLAMLAGFPSGVARFESAFAHEDPEAEMQRRKQQMRGLLAMALAGIGLAAAGLMLGLFTFLGALEGFEDLAPMLSALAVGVAALLQASLAILSPRVPVPGSLTERRRGAAWQLSMASLLLTLFGLLLGSGMAQGPGVGPSSGLLLLLGAALASGGHSMLRVVLPPPKVKLAKPKVAKTTEKPERELKEQVTRSMHLVYVAGLGLTVVMIALIASTSLGVVDVEASTGLSPVVLVVLVGMAGFPVLLWAVWRNFQARKVEVELRRRAQTQYKKRLTAEEVSRLTIIAASISAAVVMGIFGLLTQFGMLRSLGPIDLGPKYSTDFFVFAILVGLGPYGFMRAREQARMAAIDGKFPEFLRDLAESKRAGMTLTQAVITASKGSYGALTPDIRKMAAQIEWGISFGEALERFAKRVKTPLIERSVSLIVQASDAGGNVVDILHAAAEDAREIQLLLRERKTAMSIYVMIIYISFFVFLSVIAILDAQFLPQVAKAVSGAQGVSVGPIKFGAIDIDAFKQVFFHAAIIQGMGGGFVAGVMSEGKPIAGLRHVFVMVIFGYIAFRFVIG
jgi:flagellar protein FlaJ